MKNNHSATGQKFKKSSGFFLLLFFLSISIDSYGQVKVPELDWTIEIVYDGGGFTEGPAIAPEGLIYFSDMDHSVILRYDPVTGKTEVWQENSRTANGLFIQDNKLYACEATGRVVVRYDLAAGPKSREVITSQYEDKRYGSPNDLAIVDKKLYFSEFWLGARLNPLNEEREIFENRVYLVSLNNNKVEPVKYSFEIPNGVAASPDGSKIYMGDIRTNKIIELMVENGKVIGKKTFADLSFLEEAGPDGMAVSKSGSLFIALFREGKIIVLNPDGKPLGYLNTGPRTTNCILTPSEDLLYITADGKLKRVNIPADFL